MRDIQSLAMDYGEALADAYLAKHSKGKGCTEHRQICSDAVHTARQFLDAAIEGVKDAGGAIPVGTHAERRFTS